MSSAETLTQIWKCWVCVPSILVVAESYFKAVTSDLLVKEDVLFSNNVNRLLLSCCSEMHWIPYRTSSVSLSSYMPESQAMEEKRHFLFEDKGGILVLIIFFKAVLVHETVRPFF